MTEQNITEEAQIDPGTAADADTDSAAEAGTAERPIPREQRYRLERNAARDELAAAQARIERMQRNEAARIAAEVLAQGTDLFDMTGNAVDSYLTESGDVDADRVREDARLLLEERPRLGKLDPPVDTSQGSQNGAPGKREPHWGALLKD